MTSQVLVIGEKPSQVKTISNTLFQGNSQTEKVNNRLYLRKGKWGGKDLVIIPLIGHIASIDTSEAFGWNKCAPIDIVSNPKALVMRKNTTYERIISQKAKSADELWLATDPDSEGDNIAFEAYEIAVKTNPSLRNTTRRVWNSSLTKMEILRAFENLIPWELHLALAVQGRRYTDAWVGFAGTREVTGAARKVIKQRGLVLSVGRVQLPTLKIIVDRDLEREAFQQKQKFKILADIFNGSKGEEINSFLTVIHEKSPFDSEETVATILEKIKNIPIGIIIDFFAKESKIPPPRPLNTTDALSLLSKELKIKAEKAMELLSNLYEEGYISYPRTDNRRFKPNFPHAQILRKLIDYTQFVSLIDQITDMSQVKTNGKQQGVEDHDPIHPTGKLPQDNNRLSSTHFKAWNLISRHYIGMFMPFLVQKRGTVKLLIKDEPFKQQYQDTQSEGWTQAIYWKKPKESQPFHFQVGQIVKIKDIRSEAFKTKPPNLWSDSTLIKRLEKLRIGTKSSRPEIIKKLESRNYIRRFKQTYSSTTAGRVIIQVFEEIWPDLVTPAFTRRVEQLMDEVATKKANYETMLESIRNLYLELHQKLIKQLPELQTQLKKAYDPSTHEFTTQRPSNNIRRRKKKKDEENLECPICHEGNIQQRVNSRTGEVFFGCTRYPACKWTSPSKKAKDGAQTPLQTSKDVIGSCPNCQGTLLLKRSKKYRLIGCSKYPKCDFTHFLPRSGRLTILRQQCVNCHRHLLSHTIRRKDSLESKKKIFCIFCQDIKK